MRVLVWFTGLAWMTREGMEIEDLAEFVEVECANKVWFITTPTGLEILRDKGVVGGIQ